MTIPDALAILGVIAAFLTLAWQVRDAAEQARMQVFMAYTARYEAILSQLPFGIESMAFRFDGLDKANREAALRAIRAYFDLCSEEHYLRRQRRIRDEVWALWCGGMRTLMPKPAFASTWPELLATGSYSREFARHVLEMQTLRDGEPPA